MEKPDYLAINREAWNKRTEIHFDSEFYDNRSFIAGRNALNDIELPLLGDVQGKSILHLQCHFGQDSISLARMGAKVTGIDLSDKAIEKARALNDECGTDARFICCDVYETPLNIQDKFDMVFTSYGTIGWLPDIQAWADTIVKCLKPGGRFIFAEFHPVVWMFDDDFQKVQYRYFHDEAIDEVEEGTYTNPEADLKEQYISWNHGMGEVVSALLQSGLQIEHLEEYDYSPYDCFRHTEQLGERKYRIKHLGNKIPMVYSIAASLPNQ